MPFKIETKSAIAKGEKRFTDVIGNAVKVMRIATSEESGDLRS
jgi:hypothetical protein